MKRRKLRIITLTIMSIYGFALLIGFILSTYLPDVYILYKDLSIIIVAIPAAYLAYSFQRRMEYIKTLKDLWYHMIIAVQNAIQYTYTKQPTPELHAENIVGLSMVIDEVRASFKNVGETDVVKGVYPFEPIKEILKEIVKLGYQDVAEDAKQTARNNIIYSWKELRYSFLKEFDRDTPIKPTSKWLNQNKYQPNKTHDFRNYE